MSTIINDVVEWLKNWFYTETEVDAIVNTLSPNSHTHGNLSNDGKISTKSSTTMLYFCGVGSSANTLYKSNKLSSDIIIDGTAHSNIGSSANASQSTINTDVDTKLGNINTLIGDAIIYINQ